MYLWIGLQKFTMHFRQQASKAVKSVCQVFYLFNYGEEDSEKVEGSKT